MCFVLVLCFLDKVKRFSSQDQTLNSRKLWGSSAYFLPSQGMQSMQGLMQGYFAPVSPWHSPQKPENKQKLPQKLPKIKFPRNFYFVYLFLFLVLKIEMHSFVSFMDEVWLADVDGFTVIWWKYWKYSGNN